ncbi:MAG: tyrosine-type recombinase/integrase [Hydrogenophaga sp.]|nr:tyrosine-type recombinase/integrase [Hydrogenophaga sp.]
MAQVEGLNLRGSRWYVRIIIPDDLRGAFGKARVNIALSTSERREAVLRATVERAKWLADFEAKRSALKASPLTSISPQLAALLAARVRATVLAQDDGIRADLSTLADLARVRREIANQVGAGLRIPTPTSSPAQADTPPPRDDLMGMTPEEQETLTEWNAYLDGKAAVALARGNLAAVLPLVEAEARSVGIVFTAKTPGAREALAMALKAYRAAHRERGLRDVGEVVETPLHPIPLASNNAAPTGKPKTLRDVFDRWKRSGATPRSDDAVQAMDRAVRQFEGQHPTVTLRDTTRELGDAYRSWLLENSGTPKTARDRLTGLKTLLKYAHRDLEWTERHTWEGLDIKARTTNKRRAITADEMAQLFGTAIHTAYALPKVKQAGRDAAYWIPLLGAFTGARLGELCQLRAVDVQTVGGIPALVLTDEGEGQRIKSAAGHRTIPIHSELVRLGFLGYAAAMQQAGHESLWPHLPMRRDKPSDYFGRWFKDFRTALDMGGTDQPSFHYFRHTVRPLMRQAGIDAMTRDKVTGHESAGSVGDAVYDSVQLSELVPAVAAIQYPALLLPVVSPHASK